MQGREFRMRKNLCAMSGDVQDWRSLADRFGLQLGPAAAQPQIDAARRELGHPLSPQLTSLYSETDGLFDEWGYAYVLPIADVVARNHDLRTDVAYRSTYMPFGSLVFFGQLGNGDLFGHPVLPERVRDDVFVWDHEDDSRNWYAPDVSHALSRFFAAAVDPDSVSD